MSSLPIIFPDNNSLIAADTVIIRNNTVTDCFSDAPVFGIRVVGFDNVVLKNNKVLRANDRTFGSFGISVENCGKVLMQYNAISRCTVGLRIVNATNLYVYNLTAHNCNYGCTSDSAGTFRNIAFSAGVNTKYYQSMIGFSTSAVIDLNYFYYYNLSQVHIGSGSIIAGDVYEEIEILYLDEPNDDCTPDHISELVNAGTTNLLGETTVDIGGVVSEVTDDSTANRNYFYDLLDTAFWDVDNPKAVEVALIKAFQSRIIANSQLATKYVSYNTYLKTAESLTRFTELYPMYSRYCSAMQFKKRVMDVWYAGQNVGTVQAYQNAIGGYNRLPSFLKRLEDISDSWIIGTSYIDLDNYLLGTDENKFGIGIDVLGWSTLTLATSAECYRNVMNSVADIAPVYWITHDEVQPFGYLVFADKYNGFENCTLENMMYSDDYTIVVNDIDQIAQLETPMLLVQDVVAITLGTAPTGQIETSILDRVYSEAVDRYIYYRLSDPYGSLTDWTQINKTVGEVITVGSNSHIQFKIVVQNLPDRIDYEFVALALRGYTSSRVWDID